MEIARLHLIINTHPTVTEDDLGDKSHLDKRIVEKLGAEASDRYKKAMNDLESTSQLMANLPTKSVEQAMPGLTPKAKQLIDLKD
jgi:hypothetical protein